MGLVAVAVEFPIRSAGPGEAEPRPALFRNGHALIASSAITSVLGMAYWVLAAHSYSARQVGLNSAAISAMMFVAGASQLNLGSALLRFVPSAGRGTRALVQRTYLVAIAVGAAGSLMFLAGLGHWASQLSFLGASPVLLAWFSTSTICWCLFVMEDSVLIGLRRAMWVPAENTCFGILKIVLLVALAGALPHYGIFCSWTLAALFTVIPTNALIFGRLLPLRDRAPGRGRAPTTAQIRHYVAGDYLGGMLWLASITLVPVIVTTVVGPVGNAYFSLAWSIAFLLYLVAANMGSSLVVEASTDQSQLAVYAYRVLVHALGLIIPAMAILVVAAPWVLACFGHRYAAGGTGDLRLLAVSGVPNAVNAIYVSVARVQRRTWAAMLVLGSIFGLLVILTVPLLHRFGITGVGWAWLISQTVVASVVAATGFRRLWTARDPSSGAALPSFNPIREWIDQIDQGLVRLGLPSLIVRLRGRGRRHLADCSHLVPRIVASAPADCDLGDVATWQVQALVSTVTDVTVATVGPRAAPAVAMLKLPRSPEGAASLHAHRTAVRVLAADDRLLTLSVLLPELLASGELEGQAFLLERVVPGRQSCALLSRADPPRWLLPAAAQAISSLHERTAVPVTVDGALLQRLVDDPLDHLAGIKLGIRRARSDASVAHVRCLLRQFLGGQQVSVGWTHGDYTPPNIFVDHATQTVTAILDWERARPDGLAALDLVHFLIASRAVAGRCEIGDVVRHAWTGRVWEPEEQRVLLDCPSVIGPSVASREMVLLSWLHHVNNNLEKSPSFSTNRYWIRHNVASVLECLQ